MKEGVDKLAPSALHHQNSFSNVFHYNAAAVVNKHL